jgi:hypothetical protein
MRWAGHVACKGEERCIEGFGGKPERDHLEGLGVAEGIILRYIFKKCNGRVWMGLKWLK